jgi:hypothetical protein
MASCLSLFSILVCYIFTQHSRKYAAVGMKEWETAGLRATSYTVHI